MRILCCYLSLVLSLGSVSESLGADHLVSETELSAALVERSGGREADLEQIRALLNDEGVRAEFSGIADLDKVEASIANLDDETLRALGDRARRLHHDVSGEGNTKLAIILVVAIIVGSVILNLIPRE